MYTRDLQDTKEDLYFIDSLVHRGISKVEIPSNIDHSIPVLSFRSIDWLILQISTLNLWMNLLEVHHRADCCF